MIISVLAANGKSGKACVRALLDAGYIVRAGVRGSHDYISSERLDVIECDALKSEEVDQLVDGCDAVVSMIGHIPGSPPRLQTEAISNVLAAMRRHGVTRLISLTGTGVRFDGDRPSIVDRLANVAIKLIDPNRIRDGIEHAEALKRSQLDWTMIRVLKLSNGKHEGGVTFSLTGPAEFITPRRRVAAATVQLLKENNYIRQAPIITGGDG